MSCVVGWEATDGVYMACDSASSNGWDIRVSMIPKVFRKGPLLVGFTGSWRMGQLLRYQVDFGPVRGDALTYLNTTFIETVRTCFKDHGFSEVNNNQEEGGTFLVGLHGKLYWIDCDFQVNWFDDHYLAIGCGAQYALGALHATQGLNISPTERLRLALRAAGHHSAFVREPFHVEVQRYEN